MFYEVTHVLDTQLCTYHDPVEALALDCLRDRPGFGGRIAREQRVPRHRLDAGGPEGPREAVFEDAPASLVFGDGDHEYLRERSCRTGFVLPDVHQLGRSAAESPETECYRGQ